MTAKRKASKAKPARRPKAKARPARPFSRKKKPVKPKGKSKPMTQDNRIAFKAFNEDMTCRGFQFEVGKTYQEAQAILCQTGFHACPLPFDCWSYYPGSKTFARVSMQSPQGD